MLNITQQPALSDSILINERNLPNGVVYRNKSKIYDTNYWHKFTVKNALNIDRDDLLMTLIQHVYPLDLLPTNYYKEQGTAYFLARSCGPAIEKLCFDNLEVKYPGGRALKLSIEIKFSTTKDVKINVSSNISTVLEKRFCTPTKYLNLENFHKDPELTEFCPLAQPKIMYFVLHLAQSLRPKKVNMANNGIKSLAPLETLTGHNIEFLNLRDNKIEDLNDLKALKNYVSLKELVLDNNPLCETVNNPYNYISAVRGLCPTVKKLDGIMVQKNFNVIPPVQRNYFCDSSGLDLISRFIEYYFTIYDSGDRRNLRDLYDKDAFFSLSWWYNSFQTRTTKWSHYKMLSRNIKQLSDMSKLSNTLFTKHHIIDTVFTNLPPTEHDPYSFTVDLIHYTPACAIVAVCGLFREFEEIGGVPSLTYHFSRTFVLKENHGSMMIVNEMMHINNAFKTQVLTAFNIDKPLWPSIRPEAATPSQKEEAANAVSRLTTLNTNWAKKCLEDTDYDIQKTLTLFVDLFKSNRLPAEAFAKTDPKPDQAKSLTSDLYAFMNPEKEGFNDIPKKNDKKSDSDVVNLISPIHSPRRSSPLLAPPPPVISNKNRGKNATNRNQFNAFY
ncbi:unnamed protein product [Brassicogethes aeneus]|uniref:Nuclear RNA export factor 1 n=1 Tax=Brassicogethes aeneus TaxID=1431903 RepID=A0A9P0FMU1_BRAAE|nr:unnamed protein product [Brassicogethes aeneus]